MCDEEPQEQYVACPNCGKEYQWSTYFAGKVLSCESCDRKFLAAAAEGGQALLFPDDATPRSIVTMAALASMAEAEEEFYDPRSELPEGADELLYELTVLSSARAQAACGFCGAAVMDGAAVCGRCGRNPTTGEVIEGMPQAAWSPQERRKGMLARLFQRIRVSRKRRRRARD